MKKTALLLTMVLFSAVSASAAEPLLLEPLNTPVLSTSPATTPATNIQPATNNTNAADNNTNTNEPKISFPTQPGVYEATFTPASKMDSNMVPQNAAAEGKPVPEKGLPRVRIQTKQRSQGNAYWNAGGKGTKSFF